jgi:hypothetical protein
VQNRARGAQPADWYVFLRLPWLYPAGLDHGLAPGGRSFEGTRASSGRAIRSSMAATAIKNPCGGQGNWNRWGLTFWMQA